jgi:hypothetical protein
MMGQGDAPTDCGRITATDFGGLGQVESPRFDQRQGLARGPWQTREACRENVVVLGASSKRRRDRIEHPLSQELMTQNAECSDLERETSFVMVLGPNLDQRRTNKFVGMRPVQCQA